MMRTHRHVQVAPGDGFGREASVVPDVQDLRGAVGWWGALTPGRKRLHMEIRSLSTGSANSLPLTCYTTAILRTVENSESNDKASEEKCCENRRVYK